MLLACVAGVAIFFALSNRAACRRHAGLGPVDVEAALRCVLDDSERHDAFDLFLTWPIDDPYLESIRKRCHEVVRTSATARRGEDISQDGKDRIRAILRELLATRYTAAWCSGDAARVAAFLAEGGSLKINDGPPSVGRTAIAAAAQGFMSAFPDMVVTMDGLSVDGSQAVYRWTLIGTNTGPGGTGRSVRISGHEECTIGSDGLIAESKGHFDEADYQRQLSTSERPTAPRA